MELGEAIAIPVPHQPGENENCPFCPVEKGKGFKTYRGATNNSDKLEQVMEAPNKLLNIQKNAWPHSGKEHPSRSKIEARYEHPKYGFYEFQAHHLISGEQALKNHAVEKWLSKDENNIEEDTGYTVNGSLNGIWAPSWPKSFRTGASEGLWNDSSVDKQEIADYIMEKARCQFHLGGHSIGDPLDTGETQHLRYDNWLKKELTRINLRMWGWSRKCLMCSENGERKKPPFQPNERINKALNKLSKIAHNVLTSNRKQWFTFLSKLALNYHLKGGGCSHPIPGRKSAKA